MIGTTYTTNIVAVDDAHSALALGSGDLPVLGTPAMVAVMENAAMMALAPHLAADQTSVGTAISIEHTRATPPGATMAARATIIEADGRRVEFEVVAHDPHGTIGSGRHTRFIVNREKFMSKL